MSECGPDYHFSLFQQYLRLQGMSRLIEIIQEMAVHDPWRPLGFEGEAMALQ
jgi:hypothetical protein